MIRVISGIYKGRKLVGDNVSGTRPTMDRVKESLFAMLQSRLKRARCLDLFAGSGALGIEAISNGASFCQFVDSGKQIIKFLEENVQMLNADNYAIYYGDFRQALSFFNQHQERFDLIFLDPPYQSNYLKEAIQFILEYHLLESNGFIICESEEVCDFPLLRCYKKKKYGTKYIYLLEYDENYNQ